MGYLTGVYKKAEQGARLLQLISGMTNYLWSTEIISYSTTPAGVVISTSESTVLPIKPRAIVS